MLLSRTHMIRRVSISGLLLALAACGGTSVDPIHPGTDSGAHSANDATPKSDGGTGAHAADAGPVVYVRVNALQTQYGTPSTTQETPLDQSVAILGVSLLKDASDPSPLVVVNNTTPVITSYNNGASTLIGTVPASALTAGTYTVVSIPVSYVTFTVAGTLHYNGAALPGDFSDTISLSAGSVIDGATHDRGWWSSSFSVNGQTYGTTSGENSAIAQPGDTSDIALDLSGPVAAYVFPLTLTIPPSITEDMEIVFTANTYQDFHWQDESETGYTTGVFDVSVGAYEPVTQLGANSATVTIAPATGP